MLDGKTKKLLMAAVHEAQLAALFRHPVLASRIVREAEQGVGLARPNSFELLLPDGVGWRDQLGDQ